MKKIVSVLLALVMCMSLCAVAWATDPSVAKVGENKYTDLHEALEAAVDGGTVELLSSVTLTGEWTPVGNNAAPFTGTINGNKHTITGLTINGSANYAGLIGVLSGGAVADLKFASVSVSGGSDVGAVVGRIINGGKVSNVHILSGTVTGAKRVGGVAGSIIACGDAISCTNAAAVNATERNAGGIVGSAYYTETGKTMNITGCINTGTVTANGVAGGIVSLSSANVSGNKNAAEVRGTEVGGIVGEQKSYGSVTNNTNTGNIVNTSSGGYGAGGIVGWLRYHGTSEADAYPVSDIITVSGNNNSGNVTGGNDAGGIIGTVYNSAVILANINTAQTLSGATFAAGIVGNYQVTEVPAAAGLANNKVTFRSDNTSATPLESINAQCKALLIYDNTASATDPDASRVEYTDVPQQPPVTPDPVNPNPDPVNPDPTPVKPERPDHPIRRYPAATTTTEATTDGTDVTSAKTFDGGVMLYAGMALTSAVGMAWMGKKRGR